jgi:hypothetical protein
VRLRLALAISGRRSVAVHFSAISIRSNFFKAPCTLSGSKRITRLIFRNGTSLLVRHSRSVLGLTPNSFANSNSRNNCFTVACLDVVQRYAPLNAFCFLNETFKGDTS